MKSKSILWAGGFAAALTLAFGAGVVVGESQAPEKMRGVEVGAPTSLYLGTEMDSVEGRHLRLRVITFEPGGAVPMHAHKDRPAIAYVIKGTLTEHREGVGVVEHAEGDSIIEDGPTVHWAENRTGDTVVVLAADVFKP